MLQIDADTVIVATQGAEGASEVRQLKLKAENLLFIHPGHGGGEGADPTKTMLADNMPLLLNTAWSLSALDIEQSVSASHVTRHTSHVTRHTSHVTRHTSHITRHSGKPCIQIRHPRRRSALANTLQTRTCPAAPGQDLH